MRCSSRCASSRRPASLSSSSRHFSSSLMPCDRLVQRRARRHIVRVGVDLDEFELVGLLAGERIEFGDRLDLVAEQGDAPGAVLIVRREDLDRVAAHAERAAHEIAPVRLYCSATRSAMSWRWSMRSPCFSAKVIAE